MEEAIARTCRLRVQGGIAERKAMIACDHELSISRQSGLLGISRVSVYYLPKPVSEDALVRRIDELHLEHPFMGARMLRRQLRQEGVKVGRRHIGSVPRPGGDRCGLCPPRHT